jgi:hypothetical protein
MAKNHELEKLLREAGIETEVDRLHLQVCNLQTLNSLQESLIQATEGDLLRVKRNLEALIATEDLDFVLKYLESLEIDAKTTACHFKIRKIKDVLVTLIRLCRV